MPKLLSDLEPLEVSLVPKGANKKKFMIIKMEGAMNTEELVEIFEQELPEEVEKALDSEEVSKQMSDKDKNAVKGALRLLNSLSAEMKKAFNLSKLAEGVGYKYPYPDKMKKQKPMEGDKDKMKKSDETSFENLPEEIKKSIELIQKESEEQKAKTEKLQKELDENKAQLQKERDERDHRSLVEKAKEFGNVSVDAEKLAGILKGLDEDNRKAVLEIIKGADEQLKKSAIFEEIGSNGTGSTDSMSKLEEMANGLVEKSESGLTYEQAFDQVIKTDKGKELLNQHYREVN